MTIYRPSFRRSDIDWPGIIMILVVSLLMAACLVGVALAVFFGIQNAINAPSSGVIHDKVYTPESVTPQQICSGSGTSTICTTYYVDNPATWPLDLYNKNGKHGWIGVTEATYDSHNVGDYIKLGG